MSGSTSNFLVALGGNLPSDGKNVASTIGCAVRRLVAHGVHVRAVSRFFATPCFPPGAGPDYVNAAIAVESSLSPHDFMTLLHTVEHEFGRQRLERWGARVLDLDLLACGQAIYPDVTTQRTWVALAEDRRSQDVPQELILPHPRLQDRAFVLCPVMDICPEWQHPVLKKTISQLCDSLPEDEIRAVRPL